MSHPRSIWGTCEKFFLKMRSLLAWVTKGIVDVVCCFLTCVKLRICKRDFAKTSGTSKFVADLIAQQTARSHASSGTVIPRSALKNLLITVQNHWQNNGNFITFL